MSHRMKMNQHISTMARPPGDVKLVRSDCSGAFLVPQQFSGITGRNACSRCWACKGLFINGQRIHPITRHPLSAAEQSSELENATNQFGGVSHLAVE